MTTTVAACDTKPYDRESLARAEGAGTIDWRFFDFRLRPDSARAASGAQAVCVFVKE
jgi:D-lactate dehydrogenase